MTDEEITDVLKARDVLHATVRATLNALAEKMSQEQRTMLCTMFDDCFCFAEECL